MSAPFIAVYAHWAGLSQPQILGHLHALTTGRAGTESFAFEADTSGLQQGLFGVALDPHLGAYAGYQYPPQGHALFGLFADTSPDRWGRMLMRRRWERQQRQSPGKQALPPLREIDFLLGVHDAYRVGALRFRLNDIGPFLDDRTNQAAPPFVRLRALQTASLALERDTTNTAEAADEWLRMLIAPGGSLGGARPKASVIDKDGNLWIAKFPSAADDLDVGGWELIVQTLARAFGLRIPESQVRRFASPHHCFMVRRFDRTDDGQRVHFASAMTLTGHRDGDDASTGVSYLELAQILVAQGAQPATDLRELWCRIVFNLLVSNTDDHLRNHGFLLDTARGWRLSPAYDMNPVPDSTGLKLNISLYDNALDLDLALSVAKVFRVPLPDAREQIEKGRRIVRQWRVLAEKIGIPRAEQAFMAPAFRLADI